MKNQNFNQSDLQQTLSAKLFKTFMEGLGLLAIFLLLAIKPVMGQNPIPAENLLTGSPASEWDISGYGDPTIQGFATQLSINTGGTVEFKVDVDPAVNYSIRIYRLGYYDGLGARLVQDLGSSFSGVAQPDPLYDNTTGRTYCTNWEVSATWTATNALSGVYIARLTRNDNNGASHIVFIVRDDTRSTDILVKTSDATWQAYNAYGGNNFYTEGLEVLEFTHAVKGSYDRPFYTRGGDGWGYGAGNWLFNAEYPMIRWLERNGYDLSYTTDVDMGRELKSITPAMHQVLISVGHDEYWSATARANFETARANGVHLAFFSGNEVYWKTRWEDEGRTLVCYKEGTMGENTCGYKCDPSTEWTGLWRAESLPPATDGGRPENALTGQISWYPVVSSIQVPSDYKNLRFWRNTSVALLEDGQTATMPYGTLGYEMDWEQYFDTYPAGRITMSRTVEAGHTHKLSLYRYQPSNAIVFGAGTVQWSWGLDGTHDGITTTPSLAMQQATVNLFADMGVQPASIQGGLIPATASSDITPAVSVITSPTSGTSFSANSPVTISGTASDADGIVAAVDVSVDGGLTWRPATGTTSWTFTWIPTTQGSVTIKSHAIDDSYNIEPSGTAPSPNVIELTITEPVAPICPCTIWEPSTVPVNIADPDASAAELGVKFRSKANGYITGIRFYKSSTNTGTHIGNLWSASGTNLATVTFINETATGWQEVAFGTPIQITTGTTYVASYHTSTGHYSEDDYYNFTQYGNTYYLEALADGVEGANGVYNKSSVSAFPTTGYLSSNYYVDVVFNTTVGPDNTPPVVVSVNPSNNGSGVAITNHPTAYFNEALNTSTVNSNTVLMTGPGTTPVAGTVSCTAGTVTFTPDLSLEYSTTYILTLKGGYSTFHIEDLAGNGLASDYIWTFTTSAPPPPPPTEGPGGPILVISSASNPFSRYPVEILRAEGLNEFYAMDVSQVTPAILNIYDVVILGEFSLSSYSSFVTELTTWVNAGGTLVALRPDAQLASLLGISPTGITLSDKYLLINTTSGPGVGLVNETIQFHGPADLYTLNGATSLATFYSDAITPTINPAVTQILVGSNGGKAIAFTYDLAKSVVYTRQGNPAWINQKRDGAIDPIRADDMFFPDWIDFNKIAIPQADEQQRLLSNIIIKGNLHRKPMPRFWFLPKGLKAAIVMTGDNHGDGGMKSRFDTDISLSPAGCSVNDWECVRSTGYLYTGSTFTNADAQYYNSLGFETALHVNSNCAWYNYDQYANFITTQMNVFNSTFPSIPSPQTHRVHCGAWSGFSTTAEVEAAKGLRLDANYYYWPNYWTQNRPGMFTGSGMPMRFAKLDGSIIDCYQLTTQIQDEGHYPPVTPYESFTNSLLDKAIGPEGYYGVFCANMHFDTYPVHQGEIIIVNSAQARGIPVVSCKQMLDWLDGRNSSSFGNISWANNILSFSVAVGSGANNLRGMLPVNAGSGELIQLTKVGNNVTYTIETIKGISYAFFPATAGEYNATYGIDDIGPVISNVVASPHADGTATITWTTDEVSDSRVDYDLDNETLDLNTYNTSMVTSHSITLSSLLPSTTYYYRVTSTDDAIPGNSATFPPLTEAAYSFTMPYGICAQDQTKADFDLGTTDANTMVTMEGDGAIILKPAFIEDFSGGSLPAGWTTPAAWNAGGTTAFSGGQVILDGTHMASTSTFGPGSTLEFIATYTAGNYQNVGFTYDALSNAPWAVIGRGTPGDNNLYARAGLINGGPETNLPLGSNLLGSPHNYKIKWNSGNFDYYVDGAWVQTIPIIISSNMVIQISDYVAGGAILSVDWLSITPYAPSGSFTSRVFDGGVSKLWQTATWTADLPASTSLSILVRKGNTSIPDGSWTSFTQIQSSGDLVGGTSRYIQYRADLATSNPIFTPVFKDITITCSNAGPDLTPPVISNIVAAPYNNGTATITWTTDEASDSKVDYGTTEGMLDMSATNVNMVTSHSITLTGLAQNTDYYYRVTSKDIANNSRTIPEPPGTMSFITPLPDQTPPIITAISADPHTDGTAIIAWTTDENSDSKVDYGTTEGSLNLSETNISMVTSHTVILTGLTQGLTYYYRVTSKDAGNYSSTEPNTSIAPLNFITPAVVNYCFIDQTKSNFSGGNTTNTYISEISDGELILKPTAFAEFDEMPPESEWKSFQWVPGSGTTTISGGSLTVDGTRLNTEPSGLTFTTGSYVEFSAKYNIAQFQSIGFAGGTDAITPGGIFNTVPWASFATGEPGTYLIARVAKPDGTLLDYPIPGSYLGTTHIYRIEWTAIGFNFYIDGNLVHTEPVVFANPMRVAIADYFAGGPTVTVDWIHASPFSSSGTFESRIFDPEELKTWGSAIWTADLPSGTTVLVSARKGNTPTPDASWSVYSAISSSGASVGGTSRYIQYMLNLATIDMNVTPVFKDISFECLNPPATDEIAPVITNVVATPNPDGVSAIISWQTDEVSDSRVDYGLSEGLLNSNTFDNNDVFSHTLTLTGLTQDITYYFRVTSADASGNFSTSPNPPASPLSFTTPVQSVTCFNDQTYADFNAGTKTNTVITNVSDGEVTLKAKASAEFDVLPPTTEWQSFPWQTGGTSTIPSPPGGSLSVDGARFNTEPTTLTFGSGDYVEFYATFYPVAHQYIGFGGGTDVTSTGGIFFDLLNPFVSLGTWNQTNGIYARTYKPAPNSAASDIFIPGNYFNSPHLYRIEWTATGFNFYIDGDLKRTEPIIITDPMRIAISDYTLSGEKLYVDWIRSTYSSSGIFESRIYDYGSQRNWLNASWTADIPAGTTLAISARKGNTPTPDETWTAYTSITANGGSVGGTSRYIQYKADFTTSDTKISPILMDIAFTCSEVVAPVVTLDPVPQIICSGSNVSFSSAASGSPSPSVQWQISANGTDWTNINGATNSTLSFVALTADNGKQYRAVWTNGGGSVPSDPATLTVNPTSTVSGLFTYYNSAYTLMDNVTINLKQGESVIQSTSPNTSGQYSFTGICPGTYNVVVSTSEDVGGINVTDAAQTNYWGVFFGDIEMVRFLAGDVTGDNNIASADASNILQYFLTQGNPTPAFASQWSFWKTGDQLISNNPPGPLGYPTITVAGSNVTQNLHGLITGDFNQSFVPGGMKAVSESLTLIYGETISVIPDMEFDLPLSAAMDMQVGAVSLIMEFPSDLLEVNGVYLSDNPNTPLMHSVSGDELRIGWNSLEPVILLEGESLLTLKVKLIGLPGEEGIRFKLAADPLNELADGDYNVIDNAVLSIDVITTSMTGTGEISLSDRLTLANHPNPFTGKTTFTYSLPVDGKVTLEIYDIVGKKVKSLVDVTQSAGDYVLSLDDAALQPGVYTATIKLDSNGNLMTRTIKIISKQ